MKGPLDVLGEVVQRFDNLGIDYFLVGSMATLYYGRPRFTQNVHLVARISARQISRFQNAFPQEHYYCPPIEVLGDEVLRKGSFNLIHQDTGIKVDIVLDKQNEFYISEFSRRRKVMLNPGLSVYIASPEDTILQKLVYYREGGSEKHLDDIRGVLMNSSLDEAYIDMWAERLNVKGEWEKI